MLLTRHLATRISRLIALVALTAALAGCQSIAGIQPISQVRVIDASPDAPALDIYQNSAATLYNVGFGTVSSYIPTASGAYTHAAYTAGTQQQLASLHTVLSVGGQYTVLAGSVAANLQMTVLRDQSTPAPAGQVALRIIGQTTRAGAFDLYLLPSGSALTTGLAPITTNIAFGSNTGYINAPSGTYSIVALPAGALPAATSPAFTGSQASYPSGSARTIVLIDDPSADGATGRHLQVITADDFDPAN